MATRLPLEQEFGVRVPGPQLNDESDVCPPIAGLSAHSSLGSRLMPVTRARESHPPRANCYLATQCGAGAHPSCLQAPSRRLRCWRPAAAAMTRRRSRPSRVRPASRARPRSARPPSSPRPTPSAARPTRPSRPSTPAPPETTPSSRPRRSFRSRRTELQSLQSLNPPDGNRSALEQLPLRAPGPGRGAGRQEDRRRPGRRRLLGRGRRRAAPSPAPRPPPRTTASRTARTHSQAAPTGARARHTTAPAVTTTDHPRPSAHPDYSRSPAQRRNGRWGSHAPGEERAGPRAAATGGGTGGTGGGTGGTGG